jgi:nicotinic acid mononucleotide adenylyltransferase
MRNVPCTIPAGPGIFLVDAPTSAVSSTDVRRALDRHEPIGSLVPARVAEHIERHGLYRTTAAAR